MFRGEYNYITMMIFGSVLGAPETGLRKLFDELNLVEVDSQTFAPTSSPPEVPNDLRDKAHAVIDQYYKDNPMPYENKRESLIEIFTSL